MATADEIVQHVFAEYADSYGDADTEFVPTGKDSPLERLTVMIWRAVTIEEDRDPVTVFATVGMSAREMRGANHRVELRMLVRGDLSDEDEQAIVLLLSNVASYPFDTGRVLDWYQTLPVARAIPMFPTCTALALCGSLFDDDLDHTHHDEVVIKFLNVVPLTDAERSRALRACSQCSMNGRRAVSIHSVPGHRTTQLESRRNVEQWQVGRDDGQSSPVAAIEDLVEEVGAAGVEAQVA